MGLFSLLSRIGRREAQGLPSTEASVLELVYIDYWAGRCSWEDVQAAQNNEMPRCACGRPALVLQHGQLICARCYESEAQGEA